MPAINPEMANTDDKTLAAGIDAVGIDNVMNLAEGITRAKQQKEQADLQRRNIEQQMAAEQARQAAEPARQAAEAAFAAFKAIALSPFFPLLSFSPLSHLSFVLCF
jgi:hypothetical protein